VKPSWVAASVRARLIATHGLGRDRAIEIARQASLEAGVAALASSAYGDAVRPGANLADAQHAVATTALWQLRVLAGWLPPGAASAARILAAWFEIANVDERLAELTGMPSRPQFDLGSLASASGRVGAAGSTGDIRAALAASEWGDPGSDEPAAIARAIRVAWARRALDALPATTTAWVLGSVALMLARDLAAGGRPQGTISRLPELGHGVADAADLQDLARRLSPRAAWALAGVDGADGLWIAEARWWRRVEDDARTLLARGSDGMSALTGAAALLAVDARRVSAALTGAARGGSASALEVLDAVA
jgi:hypothetical protein